jgi:hypothetical protein
MAVALGVMAVTLAPEVAIAAAALPTAALLYVTITGGAGMIGLGGALRQINSRARDLVLGGISNLESLKWGALKALIPPSYIWVGGLLAIYEGHEALMYALRTARPLTPTPTHMPTPDRTPSPTPDRTPTRAPTPSPTPTRPPSPSPTRAPSPTTVPAAPLTGEWEGSFHILSTSRISGEEYGSQEARGWLGASTLQEGSRVIGWVSFRDVQQSILFTYAPLDYFKMIFPSNDVFAGTVTSASSLRVTRFLGYAPFDAQVSGNTIKVSFESRSRSEGDALVVLQKPGQQSRTVIGQTETHAIVTFTLTRTGDLPPFWVPPP